MKLLKLGVVGALAIGTVAAFGQVAVAGASGISLRLGVFDGTNYSATGGAASLAGFQILAVGNFVTGNAWDVIVFRGDTNRYLRWSFDGAGNRIATNNIREATATNGAGVGDFDGDGNSEFVVVDHDGRAFAYELDVTTGAFTHRMNLGVVTATTFTSVVGVADCDGDGDSDLVLQDPTTREARYRYFADDVKGALSDVLTNGTETVTPGGTIVGASNNGGGLQLHIKSVSTGAIRVWHMNGITRLSNVPTNGWNANWSMKVGN